MSSRMPVEPGQMIARKYRVERVLGQGGMGVVVAATHEQLHQRVAIKFLLPEISSSAEAVARFTREARAAVRIQSEHVARVLDVGELDSGDPYMVMEYLDGRDLAAVLGEQGTLQPEEAVGFVLQACEALGEAHVAGIVHRDLKPSNLFVTRRPDGSPFIKVLDFGISKATAPDGADAGLTKTASFLGSPLYVSPEQLLSSRQVDLRSDIWALGIILYEALSGAPPFTGGGMMEIAANILQARPQPLRDKRPDLHPRLCAAIMKCLERKPEHRFADVGELAIALGPFAPRTHLSVERISRIVQTNALSADPSSADASRGAPPASPFGGAPPPPRNAPSTQGTWGKRAPSADGERSRTPKRSAAALWVLLTGAGAALGAIGFLIAVRQAPPATAPIPVPTAASAAPTASLDSLPEPLSSMAVPPDAGSLRGLALPGGAVPPPAARPPPARSGTPPQTAPPQMAAITGAPTAASSSAPPATLVVPRRNPLSVDVK